MKFSAVLFKDFNLPCLSIYLSHDQPAACSQVPVLIVHEAFMKTFRHFLLCSHFLHALSASCFLLTFFFFTAMVNVAGILAASAFPAISCRAENTCPNTGLLVTVASESGTLGCMQWMVACVILPHRITSRLASYCVLRRDSWRVYSGAFTVTHIARTAA